VIFAVTGQNYSELFSWELRFLRGVFFSFSGRLCNSIFTFPLTEPKEMTLRSTTCPFTFKFFVELTRSAAVLPVLPNEFRRRASEREISPQLYSSALQLALRWNKDQVLWWWVRVSQESLRTKNSSSRTQHSWVQPERKCNEKLVKYFKNISGNSNSTSG